MSSNQTFSASVTGSAAQRVNLYNALMGVTAPTGPWCSDDLIETHAMDGGSVCRLCGGRLRCAACGWFVREDSRFAHMTPPKSPGTVGMRLRWSVCPRGLQWEHRGDQGRRWRVT